jgi:hypothetical protein
VGSAILNIVLNHWVQEIIGRMTISSQGLCFIELISGSGQDHTSNYWNSIFVCHPGGPVINVLVN